MVEAGWNLGGTLPPRSPFNPYENILQWEGGGEAGRKLSSPYTPRLALEGTPATGWELAVFHLPLLGKLSHSSVKLVQQIRSEHLQCAEHTLRCRVRTAPLACTPSPEAASRTGSGCGHGHRRGLFLVDGQQSG